MKSLFFLLVSIVIGNISYSQANGYIITNEKDTIRGNIKKTGLSKKITIEVNGESKKYTPDEIISYSIDGDIYRKMEISDRDPILAKLILHGKIDLYKGEISVANTSKATVYFAKLGDGIVQIYKGTYDQFTTWVADYTCDSQLLKGKINWNKIEKVVEEYNRCMN